MPAFDAYDLTNHATIFQRGCCDLKCEENGRRFWLCRVESGVTIERKGDDGKWRISSGGCRSKVAYDPPRRERDALRITGPGPGHTPGSGRMPE